MATTITRLCAIALAPILPLLADEVPPPAYQLAAAQAQVPPALLYAIALQESGMTFSGRMVPWPWSLNVAGQSQRYTSRRTACIGLRQALRFTPATQVDVGLAQLNVGYQGHRVREPCELLLPNRNLRLAATILREQYQPEQSWLMAAGRYHRPAGGSPAAQYRHGVERYMSQLLAGDRP